MEKKNSGIRNKFAQELSGKNYNELPIDEKEIVDREIEKEYEEAN